MEDATRKFTALDSKAGTLICRIDRDELMQELLKCYLDK